MDENPYFNHAMIFKRKSFDIIFKPYLNFNELIESTIIGQSSIRVVVKSALRRLSCDQLKSYR